MYKEATQLTQALRAAAKYYPKLIKTTKVRGGNGLIYKIQDRDLALKLLRRSGFHKVFDPTPLATRRAELIKNNGGAGLVLPKLRDNRYFVGAHKQGYNQLSKANTFTPNSKVAHDLDVITRKQIRRHPKTVWGKDGTRRLEREYKFRQDDDGYGILAEPERYWMDNRVKYIDPEYIFGYNYRTQPRYRTTVTIPATHKETGISLPSMAHEFGHELSAFTTRPSKRMDYSYSVDQFSKPRLAYGALEEETAASRNALRTIRDMWRNGQLPGYTKDDFHQAKLQMQNALNAYRTHMLAPGYFGIPGGRYLSDTKAAKSYQRLYDALAKQYK